MEIKGEIAHEIMYERKRHRHTSVLVAHSFKEQTGFRLMAHHQCHEDGAVANHYIVSCSVIFETSRFHFFSRSEGHHCSRKEKEEQHRNNKKRTEEESKGRRGEKLERDT